jgi:hypothetical protein
LLFPIEPQPTQAVSAPILDPAISLAQIVPGSYLDVDSRYRERQRPGDLKNGM